MKIVIDTKNFALYGGGIAHWFAPLLGAWIAHRSDARFLLLGPEFKKDFLPNSDNWEHVPIPWPQGLPRALRHPWYDNVLFPRMVARVRPDLVMSPYHDVRMPTGVPSVISVHDLCFDELPAVYPRRVRLYYLALLRYNLRRASFVLTVSGTSRDKLMQRYGLAPQRIGVVFNTSPKAFVEAADDAAAESICRRLGVAGRVLFYSGGSEYRKNVERLAQAFKLLAEQDETLTLLVTGKSDSRWQAALEELPSALLQRVVFSGRLSDFDLRLAYSEADVVVYPSLCEGFGRVCLEAMVVGVPLACSDLPVMREVAGDYAVYFDPHDVNDMAAGIAAALSQGRRQPRSDVRFQDDAVRTSFLSAMDGVLAGVNVNRALG